MRIGATPRLSAAPTGIAVHAAALPAALRLLTPTSDAHFAGDLRHRGGVREVRQLPEEVLLHLRLELADALFGDSERLGEALDDRALLGRRLAVGPGEQQRGLEEQEPRVLAGEPGRELGAADRRPPPELGERGRAAAGGRPERRDQ